jgi:hypothetical protein
MRMRLIKEKGKVGLVHTCSIAVTDVADGDGNEGNKQDN